MNQRFRELLCYLRFLYYLEFKILDNHLAGNFDPLLPRVSNGSQGRAFYVPAARKRSLLRPWDVGKSLYVSPWHVGEALRAQLSAFCRLNASERLNPRGRGRKPLRPLWHVGEAFYGLNTSTLQLLPLVITVPDYSARGSMSRPGGDY
jgi:hypothetical protein